MNWLRWHHGTTTDPKWRVISKAAGAPIHLVIAVWGTILENASESERRGTLNGWIPENIAILLDVTENQIKAIYDAMQGRVLEKNKLTGWKKRNPKREDDSTERVRKYRETHSNAVKREETLDKIDKIDKIRVDKKEKNTLVHEFEQHWNVYPRPKGKKQALRHFLASVKSLDDLKDFRLAFENYVLHCRALDSPRFIQHGSTWFNNWRDWIQPDVAIQKPGAIPAFGRGDPNQSIENFERFMGNA